MVITKFSGSFVSLNSFWLLSALPVQVEGQNEPEWARNPTTTAQPGSTDRPNIAIYKDTVPWPPYICTVIDWTLLCWVQKNSSLLWDVCCSIIERSVNIAVWYSQVVHSVVWENTQKFLGSVPHYLHCPTLEVFMKWFRNHWCCAFLLCSTQFTFCVCFVFLSKWRNLHVVGLVHIV